MFKWIINDRGWDIKPDYEDDVESIYHFLEEAPKTRF